MKKTKKDNDMTDHASVVYVKKNDIKLSWLTRSGVIYDKTI